MINQSSSIVIFVLSAFFTFILCQTAILSGVLKIFTQEIQFILENPSKECLKVNELIEFRNEYNKYIQISKEKIEVQSQYERSQAIEKFVSCVIHDLRKPFSMLELIVKSIKRSKNQSTKEKLIDTVEVHLDKSIIDSKKLLGDILEYGKTNKNFDKDVNIIDLINECLEDLKINKLDSKDRKIELRFSSKNIFAKGDFFGLKRVIQNILWNAVEHSSLIDLIIIECESIDENIYISISNTGSYIEEHLFEKVFDPYFTKKKYSGTGLGLAICKKIMTECSGSIRCYSCPIEDWTKFTLTLLKA